MAKRFVDTELWQKEWFQDLSITRKMFVKYIFENCDCAGVWNGNYKMASFIIGEPVTVNDIKWINKSKEQFEILPNGNVFILDFINFQYGTLSENCKPHKPVIEKLKKYGLYERVSKGYSKGIQTLEEKEQEEDKEKEIEKEIEKENIKLYGEYQNVNLSKEQYNKLLSICTSQKFLNELIESFSKAIETGKEERYKANLPNAHFERLKSYYDYRKRNPEKFRQKENKPEHKEYKPYEPFILSEEERKESEAARQKFHDMLKAKNFKSI